MNVVTNCGNGIWQVKVPLPFPLQWVNAYVLTGGEGIMVIDPGLHTADAEARWAAALEEIGFGWGDVAAVVLTHHHPDHYGLAGWMQELSGAPVLMSKEAQHQARMLWSAEHASRTAESILSMFLRNGFPAALQSAMREHLDSFVALVSPQPQRIETLFEGAQLAMGGVLYTAVHTPGHAEGHLSFWDAASGRLFCGDHVLPRITPNVSLLPYGDDDPLGTYLESLQRVAPLPVETAFPGHRDPFAYYSERVAAIAEHHQERLEQIAGLLAEPRTAYEVCRDLFGDRLSLHQLRFALSETLAHLVYLEKRDALRLISNGREGDPVNYVRAT